MADWDEEDLAALRALTSAVYPERESASWPGRHIEWSAPEWGLRVTDEKGDLVSFAGLLIRDGHHDDRRVRIGGIGGVKTHPDHRGLGYAAAAMETAHSFFAEAGTVDFGLLVCEEALIPYYGKLGWQVFEGELLVEQPAGKGRFTFNRVMVIPVAGEVPRIGVVDLNGPPW